MYEAICKNLGFDCDFIITHNDRDILASNFRHHLQIGHKKHYPKKEIMNLIDTQNRKENNFEEIENKKLEYEDNYESFRLEKWNIGHRNFP